MKFFTRYKILLLLGISILSLTVHAMETELAPKRQKIDLNQMLTQAITQGNLPQVQNLINAGADVNAQDQAGETALMVAATYGFKDIVKLLLRKKARVNTQDQAGETALMIAASNGYDDIVELLLTYDADVTLKNNNGQTALDIAREYSQEPEHREDAESRAKFNTIITRLSHAQVGAPRIQITSFSAFSQLPPEIRQLIITHALDKNNIAQSIRNLRLVNREFYNFLNLDTLTRQNIIQELAKNLDVSPRTIALNIIKVFNLRPNDPITQQLLKNNPINAALSNTFLNAVYSGNIAQVRSLLKQGADINAQNLWHRTALMSASAQGHKDIVELLLNAGANVNIKDWLDGHTALIDAAFHNDNEDIIELLIKHGANLNAQDNHGWTALMWATVRGRKGIAEPLLNAGADINAQNEEGNTALMQAVKMGNKYIVGLLLKYGANVTITNNLGETALDIIELSNLRDKKDIEKMLLEAYTRAR